LHVESDSVAAIQLENTSEADSFIDFKNPSRTFRVGYDDSADVFKVAVTNFSGNALVVNSSGNVGINDTDPDEKLTVVGKIAVTASDGAYDDDYFAKLSSDYGPNALRLTSKSGDILRASDYGSTVSILTGSPTSVKMFINTSGDVGIGDTTPSYKLDVNGTIRATGDVIAYSDKRVKENIKTIDNSLEKVNQLRGVEFNKIGEDKKSIGVIAQEIEKILPEVVREDDKGMKSVAYGNITGILIEAIKELKAEVEELKKQIK
jgi:hypothetical protein